MARNRADLTVRLLGTLIGCVGVWVLWFVSVMIVGMVRYWNGWLSALFLAFMIAIPAVYGVLALWMVFRVWRQLSVETIRGVTGLGAFALFVMFCVNLSNGLMAWAALSEDLAREIAMLTGAALAGILHEALSRQLVMRSSVAPQVPPPVSKNTVGLVCFVLWLTSSSIAREVWPINRPGLAVVWAHLLGPIALAVLTYKITIHYAHGLPGLPFVGPAWHRMKETKRAELRLDRVAQFQCPACEYDVRQTLADAKTHCPECGFELASVRYPKLPAEIA